jgi:hypothetical protein
VDAASSGKDPEDVLGGVVEPEPTLEDLHGCGHELPASGAYGGALAACSDGIVVGGINVDDELAFDGEELGFSRVTQLRGERVDWPDLDAEGHAVCAGEHVTELAGEQREFVLAE